MTTADFSLTVSTSFSSCQISAQTPLLRAAKQLFFLRGQQNWTALPQAQAVLRKIIERTNPEKNNEVETLFAQIVLEDCSQKVYGAVGAAEEELTRIWQSMERIVSQKGKNCL